MDRLTRYGIGECGMFEWKYGNYCLSSDVDALEAENARLKAVIQKATTFIDGELLELATGKQSNPYALNSLYRILTQKEEGK